jgi:hypothetical protein
VTIKRLGATEKWLGGTIKELREQPYTVFSSITRNLHKQKLSAGRAGALPYLLFCFIKPDGTF